jgi:hypothetical protein
VGVQQSETEKKKKKKKKKKQALHRVNCFLFGFEHCTKNCLEEPRATKKKNKPKQ